MWEISSACACLCSCACPLVDMQQWRFWGGLEVSMGLVAPCHPLSRVRLPVATSWVWGARGVLQPLLCCNPVRAAPDSQR